MGVMQIHHHRGDGVAERRALLKPGWGHGGHPLAAARAAAAEQADLGHVRPDRGQLDALIDLLRGLRRFGKYRLAFRAGGQQLVDGSIRVRMQRPADAGAAFARQAIRGGGREVLLLPLRGRFRGVAGGLRRAGQFVKPRLQRCDAGVLRGDTCILRGDVGVRQSQPGGQRRNQRVLLGVAQLRGREAGAPDV